jgi:hypothetical protein
MYVFIYFALRNDAQSTERQMLGSLLNNEMEKKSTDWSVQKLMWDTVMWPACKDLEKSRKPRHDMRTETRNYLDMKPNV